MCSSPTTPSIKNKNSSCFEISIPLLLPENGRNITINSKNTPNSNTVNNLLLKFSISICD